MNHQKLYNRLLKIEISTKIRRPLPNQNELIVKRNSYSKFTVHINDNYMSFAAPKTVIILKKDFRDGIKSYPTITFLPLLYSFLIGLSVYIFLFVNGDIEKLNQDAFLMILAPVFLILSVQLVLLYPMYKLHMKNIKQAWG